MGAATEVAEGLVVHAHEICGVHRLAVEADVHQPRVGKHEGDEVDNTFHAANHYAALTPRVGQNSWP